ncbi:MAG: pyridoxamine 5'-phosphate oxidase family protein [Desulforhopalus sp.]
MNLNEYFSGKAGVGVISTSNEKGEVNSAVYAKPHVTGKNTVDFIMRNKLTRANLQQNSKANYLFIEHGHGFKGVRLSLTMTGEVQDKDAIAALSRRAVADEDENVDRFLVSFSVDKVLALIGGDEIELQ